MNLLKKLLPQDKHSDIGDDYDDMYVMPEDLRVDTEEDIADVVTSTGSMGRSAEMASADKVSLKLLQPKSHVEAPKIADKIKEGCIVLLDVSGLTKEKAHRLVDFLAGVAYVLGGQMVKTNRNTIVVAPAGVDVTGFAPAAEPVAEAPVSRVEEIYEEDHVVEDEEA